MKAKTKETQMEKQVLTYLETHATVDSSVWRITDALFAELGGDYREIHAIVDDYMCELWREAY